MTGARRGAGVHPNTPMALARSAGSGNVVATIAIASTRDRRRQLSSPAVVRGIAGVLMTTTLGFRACSIVICTRLRATGMPIKTIRCYAQLVSAGPGNEQERLAVLEAHRADVTAKLAEIQENLELIDHKIDVYQGRLAAGDADQLWAPNRRADAR